jgi:hypothetical protein
MLRLTLWFATELDALGVFESLQGLLFPGASRDFYACG